MLPLSRIGAVVLAAGLSSRMKDVKMTLPLPDGRTVLETTLDNLFSAGVSPVVLVLGCHEAAIRAGCRSLDRVIPVRNPRYEEGMFTSVQTGVAELVRRGGRDAFLLQPGDSPFSPPETVEALRAVYEEGVRDIVIPSFEGRGGHPLLLSLSYAPEILGQDLPQGLKSLLAAHPDRVCRIPLAHPGLLRDLDTPDDYRAVLAALKKN